MSLIDTSEIEQLRRYYLDLDRVAFYRARLANVPPYPLEELHAKRDQLQVLYDEFIKLREQANGIARELMFKGIQGGYWEYCLNGAWTRESSEWNLDGDCWSDSDRFEHRPQQILAQYQERPENPKALRAWNLFLTAFRRAPAELFQCRGKGYWAKYEDTESKTIFIAEQSLLPTQPLVS